MKDNQTEGDSDKLGVINSDNVAVKYYNEPTITLRNSGDRIRGRLYTPEKLFSMLREFFGAESEMKLSYFLQTGNSSANQRKNGKRKITCAFLVRCQDRTGIHIDELRELAGLRAPVKRYVKQIESKE